ncbi:UDP-N-acetylenolpyruvoylglucosamine reductase [Halioglobus japonicus]|nr:UDP-N-acetylenolpyruvoylglucosamine reductase [Halioglobus japonicus]
MGTPKAMTIQRGEALQHYNTLALQARAQAFTTVNSEQELLLALARARELQLPVVALGEGSNIVLSGDINALVLRQQTHGIEVLKKGIDNVTLRVAAGENWHAFVRWTLQQGYFGLENLALIPGTVGAAPIQNIGAYGVELCSSVLRVHACNIADGKTVQLSNQECEFGYRDSIFKGRLRDQLVITAVDLQLSLHGAVKTTYPALASYFDEHPQTEATPAAVFAAVVDIRRSKLPDPAVIPNAGSFFKNPVMSGQAAEALAAAYPQLPRFPQPDGTVKVSAAWMIDRCGWKGFRRDNVGVHADHALVLVNYGCERGAQLLQLADDIAQSVEKAFGVQLEIEPRVYGDIA